MSLTNIEQKVKGGEESICKTCAHNKVCRYMDNQPCIKCSQYAAQERHGRWVDKMVRDWHCSECGKKASFDGYCYDDKPNYCHNCGAKMDGDKHDTQG